MSSESSDATVYCSNSPPVATRTYIVNEELRPSDVLFGRGVNIDSYPGNVAFRKTVAPSKSSYKATRRQERKRVLAQGIIDSVHRNNGRFLRLLAEDEAKDLSVPSFYNMVWVVAEHNMVLEKVKGALRGNGYVRKGPAAQAFDTISSTESSARMPAMDGTYQNAVGDMAAIDWRAYCWRHPFLDRHYHTSSFVAIYPPHWSVSPPPYKLSNVEQQFCNHGYAASANVDPPWHDTASDMCGEASAVDGPTQPPFVYNAKVPPTPRREALTDIEHSAISQVETDRQQAEMNLPVEGGADQQSEFETSTRPNEQHLHSQLPSFSPLQRPPSSPPYAAERPPYE